jgi:hypothetical protein
VFDVRSLSASRVRLLTIIRAQLALGRRSARASPRERRSCACACTRPRFSSSSTARTRDDDTDGCAAHAACSLPEPVLTGACAEDGELRLTLLSLASGPPKKRVLVKRPPVKEVADGDVSAFNNKTASTGTTCVRGSRRCRRRCRSASTLAAVLGDVVASVPRKSSSSSFEFASSTSTVRGDRELVWLPTNALPVPFAPPAGAPLVLASALSVPRSAFSRYVFGPLFLGSISLLICQLSAHLFPGQSKSSVVPFLLHSSTITSPSSSSSFLHDGPS